MGYYFASRNAALSPVYLQCIPVCTYMSILLDDDPRLLVVGHLFFRDSLVQHDLHQRERFRIGILSKQTKKKDQTLRRDEFQRLHMKNPIDLRHLPNGVCSRFNTFSRLFFSAYPGSGVPMSRDFKSALD